ncbi:MAG: hypothetical protein C0468_07585, partial [Planctomyces sp.]|nr:hypothetical protein [Planctomyces sp.]
ALGGRTVIRMIAARTGEQQHRVELEGGPAVWVRVAETGEVLVGLARSVVCLDADTGQRVWALEGHPAAATLDAWLVWDRVVVQTEDRRLWAVSLASGQPASRGLEGLSALTPGEFASVDPWEGGGLSVRGAMGVTAHDAAGRLVSADALSEESPVLPPVLIRDGYVTVSSLGAGAGPGQRMAEIYRMSRDGRLTGLTRVPVTEREGVDAIAAVGGRLALSVGYNTIVFRAPPAQAGPGGGGAP